MMKNKYIKWIAMFCIAWGIGLSGMKPVVAVPLIIGFDLVIWMIDKGMI